MADQQQQVKLKDTQSLSQQEALALENATLKFKLIDEKAQKLELEKQLANANMNSLVAGLRQAHYPDSQKGDDIVLDPANNTISLVDKSEQAAAPASDASASADSSASSSSDSAAQASVDSQSSSNASAA